jgi:two-component system, OmpR family, response regulator
MKILLVEDDQEVARFVAKGLSEEGHALDHVLTGSEALLRAAGDGYDAMIVDRMLPGGVDGLTVVEEMRRGGNRTPVLFLSALADVDERVKGLKSGADDYLTKPFALSELLARLEVLARRVVSRERDMVLQVGDLALDRLARKVVRDGKTIDLQPREFQLLEVLMRNAGQVVTRAMLLESVWDYHFDPQTNVIDVHISRLRQKIDRGFAVPLLHTVRNAGYVIRADS